MTYYQARSTTGGSILGGGRQLPASDCFYPPHLVPSTMPVYYERTPNGAVISSAHPLTYTFTYSPTGKIIPELSPKGAFNSSSYEQHYAIASPQSWGQTTAVRPQTTATTRPQFTAALSRTQPLPYKAGSAAILPPSTARAPRPATATNTSFSNFGHHLPGYAGAIRSGAFRFGKSYGRTTADVLSEFPGGRPSFGATVQH